MDTNAIILYLEISLAALIFVVGFVIDKIRRAEQQVIEEEPVRFLPERPWPNLLKAKHAPVIVVNEQHTESESIRKKKKKKDEKEKKKVEEDEDLDVQFCHSSHISSSAMSSPAATSTGVSPSCVSQDTKSPSCLELDDTQNTVTQSERSKKKKKEEGSLEKVQDTQKKKEAVKAVHYMEALLQPPVM
ncbi:unnamed protein product [Bursaphelenchus okinawaensis]|uniref:Uncharacterized protein n=1 Tax=Bursaphelenchus okinawaensis TaxID=465554 RepID=A0A811JTS0_9BILA|nr:unnamed protein product [Bursaphelenchus okinawaensis]CAG9083456.1 unnamed protein product [Bursaphelenchus okinawaensis]